LRGALAAYQYQALTFKVFCRASLTARVLRWVTTSAGSLMRRNRQ